VIADDEQIGPELDGHIHDRGGHIPASLLESGFDTGCSGPLCGRLEYLGFADVEEGQLCFEHFGEPGRGAFGPRCGR
jgi:hypothetical protein